MAWVLGVSIYGREAYTVEHNSNYSRSESTEQPKGTKDSDTEEVIIKENFEW